MPSDPQAVLAHRLVEHQGFDECDKHGYHWPCDMARALAESEKRAERMTAERDALAEDEQAAAERVGRLEAILRLHNQTPTGKTRRCLPGCIACAALSEPETPR